jgi:hypothetical protein
LLEVKNKLDAREMELKKGYAALAEQQSMHE